MILDNISRKSEILGTAMQALTVRNDVIQHNLANVDTPGYKKKAVDFEASLQRALDREAQEGIFDLSDVTTSIRIEHGDYSYRLDGNNVDVDNEMVDLYSNAMKYEALANGVGYTSIRTVLDNMK